MEKSTMKLNYLARRFRRFLRVREAVSALEYAILVGVIAVGIGAALMTFRGNIVTAMNDIGKVVAKMPGDLSAPDLSGDDD